MKVTVVGAGNIGTQYATHMAEKGHEVILYSSKPDKIQKVLEIYDENDVLIHEGEIAFATDKPELAFKDAEWIFVTMPATMMQRVANIIEPYANSNMKIGLMPGTGGGECAFRKSIEKGAIIFGLQRVPSVCRLIEYGKAVRAVGYRDRLHVAAIPKDKTDICCQMISDIFEKETVALPNYLNITLTPSNPILHTTRLRSLFSDYEAGVRYQNISKIYEDWDDKSSELLLACDGEVQELCKAMTIFDLHFVKSLREHYESDTAEAMTHKISSIPAFKGLLSPMKEVEGGFVPDFSSRYFTADFSYGLTILVQIASFYEVQAPNMNETLEWYYEKVGKELSFSYATYGINNRKDFECFYMQ